LPALEQLPDLQQVEQEELEMRGRLQQEVVLRDKPKVMEIRHHQFLLILLDNQDLHLQDFLVEEGEEVLQDFVHLDIKELVELVEQDLHYAELL
jgi:hypothetical protein